MPIDKLIDENGQAVADTAVFDTAPPGQGPQISVAATTDVAPPQITPPADSLPAGTVVPPAAGSNTPPAAGEGDPAAQADANAPAPQPWFKGFGLPDEYTKDEATASQALRQALEEARSGYEQWSDDKKWADIGRSLARSQNFQRQEPATGQPQPAAQVPVAPSAPQRVQPDPLWERYRDPQTGNYALDKMPAQMQEQFLRYAQGVRQMQEQLYTEPEKVFAPLLESAIKPFQEKIDRLTQMLEQQPRDQEAKQFLAENEKWMLQRSPLTGRAELSPAGHKFREIYTQFMQQGAPEPIAREAAMDRLASMALQLQLAQQLNGAQAPAGAAGVPAPAAQADPRAALLATNTAAGTKAPASNGSLVRETVAHPQFRGDDSDNKVTNHVLASMRKLGVTDEVNQLSFAPPN